MAQFHDGSSLTERQNFVNVFRIFYAQSREDELQVGSYFMILFIPLTEKSPVSGASLKKAEIFYGYFDIFGHPILGIGSL